MSNCSKCEHLYYIFIGHPRSPRRNKRYLCLANIYRVVIQPELGTCDKFRTKLCAEDGCTVRLDNG